MENFKFIDLFCGIGGFHQAMKQLGGKCVFACDNDINCRRVYEDNYGIAPMGDITKIDEKDIPEHDVLCGGFPCQSFSKAGSRLGFSDRTRGTLFFDVLRIINYHHPKYILLENVRNLASHDHGNTWKVIHDSLSDAGYNINDEPIIFSPHYIGVPQNRERVFFMCVRKDIGELPEFFFNKDNIPQCSIDDVILDDKEIPNLDKYLLNDETIKIIDIWNEFIQNIKGCKLPGYPIWSEYIGDLEDIEKGQTISELPLWKKKIAKCSNNIWNTNKEFLSKWIVKAKENESFFGAKGKLEWQVGNCESPNIWDNIIQFRPSGIRVKLATYFPALVAINQTSIIGKRKRYLTPIECAKLQSFDKDFKFSVYDTITYKQLGNSVNVEVVKIFAKFMFGDSESVYKYSKENQFNNV